MKSSTHFSAVESTRFRFPAAGLAEEAANAPSIKLLEDAEGTLGDDTGESGLRIAAGDC